MNPLYRDNRPETFWQLMASVDHDIWVQAAARAVEVLPADTTRYAQNPLAATLDESQFGLERYQLGQFKRIYYDYVRPIFPTWVRPIIRKIRQPNVNRSKFVLTWPVEDRLVRFHWRVLREVMALSESNSFEFIGFWPENKRFAFVLTHDVEAQAGYDYISVVMELEEQYGFRSSFNFVPEGYTIDPELIQDMQARGFEVGVHGLCHDGRLFSDHDRFSQRAVKINRYLREWGAVGFRSPMTHRNPEWLQMLDIEYDLSFFDTDPYEPMAGGTMSIWPFTIGKFVELPYTLMQDHTYLEVFNYRTPDVWLDKVDFIRSYCGMALLNSHPDYLLKPDALAVYEAFLAKMREHVDVWHALPRDIASWWRYRTSVANRHDPQNSREERESLIPWRATLAKGEIHINGPTTMNATQHSTRISLIL